MYRYRYYLFIHLFLCINMFLHGLPKHSLHISFTIKKRRRPSPILSSRSSTCIKHQHLAGPNVNLFMTKYQAPGVKPVKAWSTTTLGPRYRR